MFARFASKSSMSISRHCNHIELGWGWGCKRTRNIQEPISRLLEYMINGELKDKKPNRPKEFVHDCSRFGYISSYVVCFQTDSQHMYFIDGRPR